MACNLNCRIETGGLFKVTSSYIHCKVVIGLPVRNDARWRHFYYRQTFIESDINIMAYRIAPFSMTSSDLQCHSAILQAFSNAIFRTVMQQLTRFRPA